MRSFVLDTNSAFFAQVKEIRGDAAVQEKTSKELAPASYTQSPLPSVVETAVATSKPQALIVPGSA